MFRAQNQENAIALHVDEIRPTCEPSQQTRDGGPRYIIFARFIWSAVHFWKTKTITKSWKFARVFSLHCLPGINLFCYTSNLLPSHEQAASREHKN